MTFLDGKVTSNLRVCVFFRNLRFLKRHFYPAKRRFFPAKRRFLFLGVLWNFLQPPPTAKQWLIRCVLALLTMVVIVGIKKCWFVSCVSAVRLHEVVCFHKCKLLQIIRLTCLAKTPLLHFLHTQGVGAFVLSEYGEHIQSIAFSHVVIGDPGERGASHSKTGT